MNARVAGFAPQILNGVRVVHNSGGRPFARRSGGPPWLPQARTTLRCRLGLSGSPAAGRQQAGSQEISRRRIAEVSYRLQELVADRTLISAEPWPAGSCGYQPTGQEMQLFGLADPIEDERQWLLDELARWASLHDGKAPRQVDWSKPNDPHNEWPRWDLVRDFFEGEALEHGALLLEQIESVDTRARDDPATAHCT